MLLQVGEPIFGLGHRWHVPDWDPPERHVKADTLKPLASATHHVDVTAAVDEVSEVIDRLPDRHVDDHPVVVEGADPGRVAVLGLEPPDESLSIVGERVHRVEQRDEVSHRR
jgi:hypothetical protein